MKHPITFLRFIPPNGRRENTMIEVEEDEFAKYREIQQQGFRMTVEQLSTGQISMCVEHPTYGDYDLTVCANGPEVVTSLRTMLLRFEPAKAAEWIKQNADE